MPGERLMEQMQRLSPWTRLHINSPAGGLECPDPSASPATFRAGSKRSNPHQILTFFFFNEAAVSPVTPAICTSG